MSETVCLVTRYPLSRGAGGYFIWGRATRRVLELIGREHGFVVEEIPGSRPVPGRCRVAWFLGYGMPVAEASVLVRRGVRVVWDPLAWFHTNRYWWVKETVYRRLLAALAWRADLYVGHTKYFADVIAEKTGRRPDIIVPCPLDPRELPEPRGDRTGVRGLLGLPAGARVSLTVGWFNELKKPWEAAEAAAEAGFDYHVVVSPRAPGEELFQRLRRLMDEERIRVRFYSGLSRRELADLYAAADVLVHSSSYEGWGYVLVEAAWYGTPAAAYHVTAVPEAAPWAATADPGRGVPALAEAAARAAEEKQVPSRKWLLENYSVDAVAEKLADTFTEIL